MDLFLPVDSFYTFIYVYILHLCFYVIGYLDALTLCIERLHEEVQRLIRFVCHFVYYGFINNPAITDHHLPVHCPVLVPILLQISHNCLPIEHMSEHHMHLITSRRHKA